MKEKEYQRWERTIALAQIGWWEADLSRHIYLCSDVVVKLLSLTSPELSFEAFEQMVRPDYQPRVVTDVRFFRGAESGGIRIPIITPRGVVWVRTCTGEEYTDQAGVKHILGTMQKLSIEEISTIEQPANQRLETMIHRQQSVANSLLAFTRKDDAEATIRQILGEMLTQFCGDRAYIFEMDQLEQTHTCIYEVCSPGVSSEQQSMQELSCRSVQWWIDQLQSNRPIVLNRIDQVPVEETEVRQMLEKQHIKSLLVVPLISKSGIRGYAGIDIVKEYRDWSSDDCQWFSSMVNIIGICLELYSAERKSEKERRYLYDIYQHMPVAYLRVRRQENDYVVLRANEACDRILGCELGAYVGKSVRACDINVGEMPPEAAEIIGSDRFLDTNLTLVNGKICHAVISSPAVEELVFMFSDMTDTYRTYEALGRSEAILRNVYENLPVGIELYDKDGVLVDLNEKELEMFGLEGREAALGVNLFDNPQIDDQVKERLRQGESVQFSFKYDFSQINTYYNSSRRDVMDCATKSTPLFDNAGRLIYYLFINIDNTEIFSARDKIQQFNDFFALIGNYAKVGYASYNVLSGEGYAVDSWYKNVGERPDVGLTQVFEGKMHIYQDDQQVLDQYITQIRNDRQIPNLRTNIRIHHDDGSLSWTCINIIVRDYRPQDGVIEIVCINYDITELKEMEVSLIAARNKAEASDRLKSAFLANMSHEIRTPLNAIVGFSEVLASSTEQAEKEEYVHIIEDNNNLLLQLISDILDLSKIEAGTLEFNESETSLDEILYAIESSAQVRQTNSAVNIIYQAQPMDCRIMTDRNRLMQVISNLINNAMKFTEQGSIRFGYRMQDAQSLYFYVTDTGCGLSTKEQECIFGRFVKLNKFAQGTGLGLSICQTIVHHLGGEIGVDSEKGKGATFWFTLPYHLALEQPLKILPEPVMIQTTDKCLTILVAEDNESNFKLLEIILGKDYTLLHAWNGKQAVELFRKQRTHLVLMDINMPEMNGYDALKEIRSISPAVPIIAVTAYAFAEDERRIRDCGFDAYAAKPIKATQLRHTIKELIGQRMILL